MYGPLRGTTGSKTLSIPAADDELTVRELLRRLAEAYPRTRSHLFTDDGSVQGSVRVMIDGEPVEPDARCPPTAEVEIVPAVRGGTDGRASGSDRRANR